VKRNPVRTILVILLLAAPSRAQRDAVNASTEPDYLDWGWTALVLNNDLITLAVVPDIGARVMQYDLGENHSIFVNEAELGKLYTPSSNSTWHNYGGYKTWPAPQERWNWPPPPNLDFGIYESQIQGSADSASVFSSGPKERWKTPDLRFERRLTIYRNTSRVKVEQTLINEGTRIQTWSVWDVTQQIVNHPGERDYDNFWVYFPINPDSRYGSSGVRTSASSDAWRGEVAPGVYGVRFRPEGKKIFADSHRGWVGYVDERDGVAYFKVFAVHTDLSYPDEGARVEVWINNNPLYLEVEVLGPMTELAPGGGRTTFTEEWYAARCHGPILDANRVGAVTRRLKYDTQSSVLSGEYGVFHRGTAQAVFRDPGGAELGRGPSHAVDPLAPFALSEAGALPWGTARVAIEISDKTGLLIGVLEEGDIDRLTGVNPVPVSIPSGHVLRPNYPNPFNPSTVIPFRLSRPGQVTLEIYDRRGRLVEELFSGPLGAGEHQRIWRPAGLASGIYFCRLIFDDYQTTRKMLLLH